MNTDHDLYSHMVVLSSSLPSTLLCRDDQLAAVREWVGERVRGEEGGALYISGAPGTGKTACVTHLLREMKVCISMCLHFVMHNHAYTHGSIAN